MKNMCLYDAASIAQLRWPDTYDGAYARAYLLPLLRGGVTPYIGNVRTRLLALKLGAHVLPVTVNDGAYENSYVCSPYTHYISYAIEELRELKQPFLERCLEGILRAIGLVLKKLECNRTVHVNNWMLSTNLYPAIKAADVASLVAYLRRYFPEHALVFRSLNRACNAALLQALHDAGCIFLPSRQIYGLDLSGGVLPKRRDVKRDLKLLAQTPYEILAAEQLAESDAERIAALYRMLYINKYSRHNPCFTARWVRLAIRRKILQITAFRRAGRIDAVLGFFQRNGVMTAPLVGYDTQLPQEWGLYRLLFMQIMREAAQRGLYLNNSSGAAQFKRNRGYSAEMEYSMVYIAHLSPRRKLPWQLLSAAMQKIGAPLLQKYRL